MKKEQVNHGIYVLPQNIGKWEISERQVQIPYSLKRILDVLKWGYMADIKRCKKPIDGRRKEKKANYE